MNNQQFRTARPAKGQQFRTARLEKDPLNRKV